MAIYGELEMKQIGFLAADPTFRKNADGSMVANFRVITNIGWKDKASGEPKSRAEGFNYEIWGESAKTLAERVKKGDEIYVVSEPRNDQYEADGVTHYTVRHNVNRWRRFAKREQGQEVGGDALGEGDVPF